MPVKFSVCERRFIRDGIGMDMRIDGRSRMDQRRYWIEEDVSSYSGFNIDSSNGSCLLHHHDKSTGTKILAVVKLEVGQLSGNAGSRGFDNSSSSLLRIDDGQSLRSSTSGQIRCQVYSSNSSISASGSGEDDVSLSQFLNRVFNQPCIVDFNRLVIAQNYSSWIVHVDLTILSGGSGNIVDMLFAAAVGALQRTRLPAVATESVQGKDFDIIEDASAMIPFPIISKPACISLYVMGRGDGGRDSSNDTNRFIVDPTKEEAECSEARLTIVLLPEQNQIVAIQKAGLSSIEPGMMIEMINSSKKIALGR